MGSRRLAEIQAAIERLADAKTTGLEAEVAAAWSVLGARLPGNVKQEDALSARQAQAATAAELMATQKLFEGSAKNVAAGFSGVRDGLETLGISDDQTDAAVDAALGIAVQAGQFFLHPETGIVVQGRQVGQLTEAMVRLAGVLQPGEEINPAAIAERLKVKPSSASHLLGRTREASGDSVIGSAGKGRYRRNPALTIFGEKPPAPVPVAVALPAEAGLPVAFPMREILQQPGIAGVLSEPQVRHLIRGLVASGHFQVGKHVIETEPQRRGKTGQITWDIEATQAGLEDLRLVAEQFGAQGKIYVGSVARALEERKEPKPAAQAADEGQRFWGAQVVADLKNVGTGALDTLQQAGIFKKGEHFEVTGSGKRVYRPAAREIARRLDQAAAAAPIGRITREFVLKTFAPPEKVKSTDQPDWENPYGPNGPKAADNDLVEFVIARAMNDCLSPDPSHPEKLTPLEIKTGHPATEQTIQLAGEVAMRLVVLGGRLGLGEEKMGVEKLYPSEYEALNLPEGGKSGANRLAAAAIMELTQNARPFNFIRRKRPTYEFALTMVRGLKQIGRPDLIEAMAHNLANPKPLTGEGKWSDGVKSLNHQSPLD